MTVSASVKTQPGITAGKITFAGPLIILAARSILAVICQILVTLFFIQAHQTVGTPLVNGGECKNDMLYRY